MTAKEKAIELIEKYRLINYNLDDTESHKEGSLIAVDEILALGGMVGNDLSDSFYIYWQEVKNELNQL